MKSLLFRWLASSLLAAAPFAAHAQVTLLTEGLVSFGHRRPAHEIPVTHPAVAPIAAPAKLEAVSALSPGVALDALAAQPLGFHSAPLPSSDARPGFITRFALDQELSAGAFRPFVGVNVGRLYGEVAPEDWSAGVAAGARYFVQPRTFIRASAEYGWLFSHARGFNDRLTEGSWTWSMGLGVTF
jgi:hypothetical protein